MSTRVEVAEQKIAELQRVLGETQSVLHAVERTQKTVRRYRWFLLGGLVAAIAAVAISTTLSKRGGGLQRHRHHDAAADDGDQGGFAPDAP